ncbi:hypothetical protein V8C42DRAFT_348822 [Trichoderma barbatum]
MTRLPSRLNAYLSHYLDDPPAPAPNAIPYPPIWGSGPALPSVQPMPHQSHQPPPNQYQYGLPAVPAPQYSGHPAPGHVAPPPGQQPQYIQQPQYQQPQYQQLQYGQQYVQQYIQQPGYTPQQYVAPPQAQELLQQSVHLFPVQQQYIHNIQPTLASPGYDIVQKMRMSRISTAADVEALREAMKGVGCDESALIRIFAHRKYQDPWALDQLKTDYEARYMTGLDTVIKGETKGNFEEVLLALIRGPLAHDIFTLHNALSGPNTDEEALHDVLLCRSNADIRAISGEYERAQGGNLLQFIRDNVDKSLFPLYSLVLSGTRAEDAAPVIPTDIDHKTTEMYRLTRGNVCTDTTAVMEILVGASPNQLRAMNVAYNQKYRGSLESVIEEKFLSGMQDALLRTLISATAGVGKADADGLLAPLMKIGKNDKVFVYRALRLYWGDRKRLQDAQAACQKTYNMSLGDLLRNQPRKSLEGDKFAHNESVVAASRTHKRELGFAVNA